MSRRLLALLLAMCLFMVVACSSSDGSDGSSLAGLEGAIVAAPGLGGTSLAGPLGPAAPGSTLPKDQKFAIKVLARDVGRRTARELARAYMAVNPGSLVQTTVDSGDGMLSRLAAGEKYDIVMDNRKNLEALSEAGLLLWRPQEFGTLVFVIGVAPGNPLGINSLKVFGEDPATRSVLCSSDKNCGKTAIILLARGNVTPAVDLVAPNASAAVNAVRDGVSDATILDSTKVANRSTVLDPVRINPGLPIVQTHWQMSSVTGSPAADSFTDFMFSAGGAAVLNGRGLLPIVP